MDQITEPSPYPYPISPVGLDAVRRAYSPKSDLDEIRKNYDYDMQRFLEHSSTHVINQDTVALSSWLVSAFYGVEKGLIMEAAKKVSCHGKCFR